MQTSRSIVRVAALAALTTTLTLARGAAAYPSALLDEARFGPYLDQIDYSPHELWEETRGRPALWIALDAGLVRVDGTSTYASASTPVASYPVATPPGFISSGSGFYGMILVGLPLDRVVKRTGATMVADGPPVLKPPSGPKVRAPEPAEPPAGPKVAPSTVPVERIAIPNVVTPSLARAAVKAALKKAALLDPAARTDALASRARTSAVLPELRLRVARIIDDGQSLMPTEYDPYRTEATGGTTLWLDARATWRLDRLVFAQEEVALERIRNERIAAQARLVSRVLESLFAWQKWSARASDGNATAEEHLAAELGVLEAEAELDILTGGWFTEWRTKREQR
jgi:hypothetical protein